MVNTNTDKSITRKNDNSDTVTITLGLFVFSVILYSLGNKIFTVQTINNFMHWKTKYSMLKYYLLGTAILPLFNGKCCALEYVHC